MPNFKPLQQHVITQFVMVMFLVSPMRPYGPSLFKQMQSSPVAISQSLMKTLRQHVGSIPSVFGPMIGLRILMPLITTVSHSMGRSVHPEALASVTPSIRKFVQPKNSSIGDGRSSGFQS